MEKTLYKAIGTRIRSTRESMGLSQEQLAHQIGYSSSATISNFEAGSRKISIEDLHRVAQVFGMPVDYFLDNLQSDHKMQAFRLRAHAVKPSSRGSVASFLSFASENGTKPMSLGKDLKHKRPGDAAWTLITQFSLDSLPILPNDLSKVLGISVFQWDFPNEISGILAYNDDSACIGVNREHPSVRQRFTVAHELGHFIYDTDQELFIDYSDMEVFVAASGGDEAQSETRANQFAADLLMPLKWIYRDFEKYGESHYALMAQDYGVSEQALWIRLVTLKLVQRLD